MGKKQHQQDKLYLTTTEWKNFYGGKKTGSLADSKDTEIFRRLPFDCCGLSFQPAEHPYCTPDGHVFDLENIVPFLKKHQRNPITGEPLDANSLFKLNFSKNAKGEHHCPITFKIFNENSHIVAVRTTGNVFSGDAVQQLNIKPNFWKDLLTDEPFVKKDLITIQDPSNLTKFNIQNFFYIKKSLKWEEDDAAERSKPSYYLKAISDEARSALDELDKTYVAPSTSQNSDNYLPSARVVKADSVNAANYSMGRVAASLTSTVMEIVTSQEPAVIEENEIRWSRMRKAGKKGYVCLTTTFGKLNIELACDQVPQTCENFLKHCADNYYKDTIFHRIIPKFMIQGGDPTGTGTGGQSIWGKPFPDEFKSTLSHNARGVLSMANSGPNTNKSQFFITFRACSQLDNVHTVFGKVVGGLDVLEKMEKVERDKKDRPKQTVKIEDCKVFVDPFVEIDEQIKAEREKEQVSRQDISAASKNSKKTIDDMKPVRSGIGKYIQNDLLVKKHSLANETESGNQSKKMKSSSAGFGDFSSW